MSSSENLSSIFNYYCIAVVSRSTLLVMPLHDLRCFGAIKFVIFIVPLVVQPNSSKSISRVPLIRPGTTPRQMFL